MHGYIMRQRSFVSTSELYTKSVRIHNALDIKHKLYRLNYISLPLSIYKIWSINTHRHPLGLIH